MRYYVAKIQLKSCSPFCELQARRNDFGSGAAMEGGSGVLPREKISKIKANCKHFRAFGAISVYGNYNERLFDSAKNQEDATIGDKHYPPPGKKFKN